MDPDASLRAACFRALDALRAMYGDELPYRDAIAQGFAFDGLRVVFMNPQKGIHRSREQRGAAALSVMTSAQNPYGDGHTEEGFAYAYRAGDPTQADNRALREAAATQVPMVYFFGTRPGAFEPIYPCFVHRDDPVERRVFLSPGTTTITGELSPILDAIERRYVVRETRMRLHQARFRGLVLTAYADRCAICRLRESRLLDASHIVPDRDPEGLAAVRNGLALCTIHHRAYDHDLVGVSADYRVHVARRLLDEDDGPMLDLLKRAHGVSIELPRSARSRPDRERLAARFERFSAD